jgi:hypothetical protein
VNCAGWDRLSEEGTVGQSLVYHGALYFIPMMIFYGGGRREEYCGMMVDDVVEDHGLHPYLHIAKNKYRRIKNGQSKRNRQGARSSGFPTRACRQLPTSASSHVQSRSLSGYLDPG